jgi:hypothetical protein
MMMMMTMMTMMTMMLLGGGDFGQEAVSYRGQVHLARPPPVPHAYPL